MDVYKQFNKARKELFAQRDKVASILKAHGYTSETYKLLNNEFEFNEYVPNVNYNAHYTEFSCAKVMHHQYLHTDSEAFVYLFSDERMPEGGRKETMTECYPLWMFDDTTLTELKIAIKAKLWVEYSKSTKDKKVLENLIRKFPETAKSIVDEVGGADES